MIRCGEDGLAAAVLWAAWRGADCGAASRCV